jgi:hypothetical protein
MLKVTVQTKNGPPVKIELTGTEGDTMSDELLSYFAHEGIAGDSDAQIVARGIRNFLMRVHQPSIEQIVDASMRPAIDARKAEIQQENSAVLTDRELETIAKREFKGARHAAVEARRKALSEPE